MTKSASLATSLFSEILQTERSAVRHSAVEAERLGPCPPASALMAVSQHAAQLEPSLFALADRRGVDPHKIGTKVGDLFSMARNRLADFVISTEQSYRGTLLGMRHGYDAVSLFGLAAREEKDPELAAWCDRWLAERAPLIAAVASALDWFAQHPERALQSAKTSAPVEEKPGAADDDMDAR